MTREETKKILAVILVSYPNWKCDNMELALNVWQNFLGDYTYSQVSNALQAFIVTDTSGFAPSIGQIVEKIQNIYDPNVMDEMSAWSLVSKALRNAHYNSQMEFDKLPDTVKRAVGSQSNLHAWSLSDEKGIETVIQSNFLRNYRIEVKRERDFKKLPDKLQNVMLQAKNETVPLIGKDDYE